MEPLLVSLSVPSALLPHDPTEEEGSGPHGGLQQTGVSSAEFRTAGETKTSRRIQSRSTRRFPNRPPLLFTAAVQEPRTRRCLYPLIYERIKSGSLQTVFRFERSRAAPSVDRSSSGPNGAPRTHLLNGKNRTSSSAPLIFTVCFKEHSCFRLM